MPMEDMLMDSPPDENIDPLSGQVATSTNLMRSPISMVNHMTSSIVGLDENKLSSWSFE